MHPSKVRVTGPIPWGRLEGLKRVGSRKAPRQAWPRVTAPQMPAVPTDLHHGQERPLQRAHPGLPPRRSGGTVGGGGHHPGGESPGPDSQRMGAIHKKGKGHSLRLPLSSSSQGSGREFGPAPSERAACWLVSPGGHVCSPPARPPVRGPQGRSWGGEAGRPGTVPDPKETTRCARGGRGGRTAPRS